MMSALETIRKKISFRKACEEEYEEKVYIYLFMYKKITFVYTKSVGQVRNGCLKPNL